MKIIPPVLPSNRTEKSFFEAIKKIDDPKNEWTFFHSYELKRQTMQYFTKGILGGEIDFLALNRLTGLVVVIEVKGCEMNYRSSKKTWFMNSQPFERKHMPDEQVYGSIESLKILLKRNFSESYKDFNFKGVLAFPETKNFDKTALDLEVIIQKDMKRLEELIFSWDDSTQKGELQTYQRLEYFFGRKFRPVLINHYCEERQEQRKKLAELTEEQFAFLDQSAHSKRAFVLGCAGSGKTLMAIKKAEELAAEGQKVLILSYNLMLCNEVIRPRIESEDLVDAFPFQEACEVILKDLGEYPDVPTDPEELRKFYVDTIPSLMLENLPAVRGRYDTIIIDEAQDLHEHHWELIEELEPNLDHLYVFYDKEQCLNRYDRQKFQSLIDKSDHFKLFKNCRNSKVINQKLKEHCSHPITDYEEAPIGDEVHVKKYRSKSDKFSLLEKALDELVYQRGVKKENIAILGFNRWEKVFSKEKLELGDYLIENEQRNAENSIAYYTYHKVKGCEFDYIIALGVDNKWNDISRYVTYSRARLGLTIIESV